MEAPQRREGTKQRRTAMKLGASEQSEGASKFDVLFTALCTRLLPPSGRELRARRVPRTSRACSQLKQRERKRGQDRKATHLLHGKEKEERQKRCSAAKRKKRKIVTGGKNLEERRRKKNLSPPPFGLSLPRPRSPRPRERQRTAALILWNPPKSFQNSPQKAKKLQGKNGKSPRSLSPLFASVTSSVSVCFRLLRRNFPSPPPSAPLLPTAALRTETPAQTPRPSQSSRST